MNDRRSGGALRSLILTTGVVVAILAIGLPLAWKLIGSPFSTEKIDHSGPVVLKSLAGLSRFEAATGEFAQEVDVEKEVSWLPDVLSGESVQFIGVGSVNAYVEFSELDEDALQISDDGKSVIVTLPEPQLTEVTMDIERSRVRNRDRGLLERLGGVFTDNPTSEQELYLIAEEGIAAAAEASELRDIARTNTDKMLEGLLNGLGFENVTVEYDNDILPDQPPAA